MALVSDLIASGVPPRQAEILGDTFATVGATGTTINDATSFTASIINCTTSTGVNAGLKLPKIDASKSKKHKIFNSSGGDIRVYVNDTTTDSINLFDGRGGGATNVVVANNSSSELTKIASGIWGATA